MAAMLIEQIPVLRDNYVDLVRDPVTLATAAIDPSVHEPVLERLAGLGWRLTHVLNTHHHGDHVGGNLALKKATGCRIVGPLADRDRIPGIDIALGDGENFFLGGQRATIFDIPGHTRGHIAYWFSDSAALFCGDTLFALGCGRLFEGTPRQMWESLLKLRGLPDDTAVYCGHEYTQANARFALTIDPDNPSLRQRARAVDAARARNLSTVPSFLVDERATNPFLRADHPGVARAVGLEGVDAVTVFAEMRRRKDVF